MSKRRYLVLQAIVVLAAALRVAQAATPSVESLARGADMSAPALSPDGSAMVYVTHTDDGRRLVALRTLDDGVDTVISRGEAGQRDGYFAQLCWFKTDQRIICQFKGTGFDLGTPYPTSRLVALNRDGSGAKVLVQDGRHGGSALQDRIVSRLPSDPEAILVALTDGSTPFPSVFRLDVFTGRATEVVVRRAPITSWVADPDGVVRFGMGHEWGPQGGRSILIARDSADGKWRTLRKPERVDPATFRVAGFGQQMDRLLVTSSHRGRNAIWELDLRDESGLQPVFAHPEVDVAGGYRWPGSTRVVGFQYETDKPQLRMTDPAATRVQSAIDTLLPGMVNRIVSSSATGRRLLVWSGSDRQDGAYYLLDLDAASLKPLGLRNAALLGAELAEMRPVKVPSRDGVLMPGYLSLPPGLTDARKLPAVVLPHGGPYSRDSWGFDPLVQLLATQGYAVLQVNFRGSTGYGDDWLKAGYQGWGTVMHEDITAAARWLVTEGVADGSRLCIVGWSYGGYAALLGGLKQPDLYRCAISIAGVSDLRSMLDDDSRFDGGWRAASESIGKVDLDAQSPRRQAADFRVPVLLVHGQADHVVLPSHSEKMAAALKRAGKPHELLMLEGGGHDLDTPALRALLYRKLLDFLNANLSTRQPPEGRLADR